MASLGYNTNEYERSAPKGTALPPGLYTMTVVRVQQKQTKDGSGVYEEVEFDIQTPTEFGNRKFWDRFNVINKSQKAQQIGREGICDLAKAAGINGALNDDQELLGKTVQGRILVKESGNPQYPQPKNECRKYYAVGVNADEADAGSKSAAKTAQADTPAAKPNWNSAGQAPAPAHAAYTPAKAPWK